MFKTHVPIDWIVALIYDDYSAFDSTEIEEIGSFVEDLRDGKYIYFLCPSDKDIEQAEYKQFNGALTECVNIGYNLLVQ